MNTRFTYENNWKKERLLFNKFHCQLPLAYEKEKEINIFVANRDRNNQSYIVKLDFTKKLEIKSFEDKPIFEKTKEDSIGCMPSCIFKTKNNIVLYYTGWEPGEFTPYKHNICACNWTKNEFKKIGIIKKASKENNYICSSPFVLQHNNIYKMWYISGSNCGWTGIGPMYSIKYAESSDGESWEDEEIIFNKKNNEIFSRPFVIIENNLYKMWYSYMEFVIPKRYKIGYAESIDGIKWERKDEMCGITTSKSGWDSEMVAFPYLINNNKIMIYSGNGFGKAGIGYASRVL